MQLMRYLMIVKMNEFLETSLKNAFQVVAVAYASAFIAECAAPVFYKWASSSAFTPFLRAAMAAVSAARLVL